MEDGFGFGREAVETQSHQRGSGRDSMFLHAQVRRGDGTEHVMRVRNLSKGGMMASTETDFQEGELVDTELRGIGRVPGRVAWCVDGRVGVAFDRTVDPRLARKTGPQSPGSQIMLSKPVASARRPGLHSE